MQPSAMTRLEAYTVTGCTPWPSLWRCWHGEVLRLSCRRCAFVSDEPCTHLDTESHS